MYNNAPHRFDKSTPVWETAEALSSIVNQGKSIYVGISSYRNEDARELQAALIGLNTRVVVNQCHFSLLCRWAERDLKALKQNLGMGVAAFSPLAQGLLTGHYANPADFRVLRPTMSAQYATLEVQKAVLRLSELSARYSISLTELALKFVVGHPLVDFAVVGLSSQSHLEIACKVDFTEKLDEALAAELNVIEHNIDIDLWKSS